MLKLTYKEYLSLALFFAVLGVFALLWQQPFSAGANVAPGNGMISTTTPTVATRTNLCVHRDFDAGLASSTTGILGSVNLTGPNVGGIIIYDATTTNNSKRVSAATSSLILVQVTGKTVLGNASTTWASWPVNAVFKRGLLVDYVGADTPTTTITYRCGE